MDYEIKVTKEQAWVIQRCLEFFSRISMGQFRELLYAVMGSPGYEKLDPSSRDSFSHLLESLRVVFNGSANTYYGISGDMAPKDAKIAWDLYQVVRNRLAWDDHPEGNPMSVCFDEPWAVSDEPLAEMKKVVDEERKEEKKDV